MQRERTVGIPHSLTCTVISRAMQHARKPAGHGTPAGAALHASSWVSKWIGRKPLQPPRAHSLTQMLTLDAHQHGACYTLSFGSLEQPQRLLPLPAVVTCADGRVGDGGAVIAHPDSLISYSHTANQVKHTDSYLLEQLQRLQPLPALVARADGRVGDDGVRPHPNALKLAQP
jgi:hypothetical protein